MRRISILGDSISTFAGYNPPGYLVYYDKWQQINNGLVTVMDTWWAQVIRALDGELCVNNSYSGSCVTGVSFPSATSPDRINALATQEHSPDLILIYIGYNDFGRNVMLTDYDSGLADMKFSPAYFDMMRMIHERFPEAKTVCGTLMRTKIMGRANWVFPERERIKEISDRYGGFEDFNDVIRSCARMQGGYLADIGALGSSCETLDGAHPTVNGHRTLADAWIRCLSETDLI